MPDTIGEAVIGEDFVIGGEGGPSTPVILGVADIPQFSAPFSISAQIDPETGVSVGADEVEQGSEADIEAQVYNVLVCPQGFRIEDPDFGIPQLQFKTVPLPAAGVLAQVQRYVPDATLATVESVLEGIEQQRTLTVEIV